MTDSPRPIQPYQEVADASNARLGEAVASCGPESACKLVPADSRDMLVDCGVATPEAACLPKNTDGARGSYKHISAEDNEIKTLIGVYRTVELEIVKGTMTTFSEQEERLELEAIEKALASQHHRVYKAGLATLRLRMDRHLRQRQHAHRLMTEWQIEKLKSLTKCLTVLVRKHDDKARAGGPSDEQRAQREQIAETLTMMMALIGG